MPFCRSLLFAFVVLVFQFLSAPCQNISCSAPDACEVDFGTVSERLAFLA